MKKDGAATSTAPSKKAANPLQIVKKEIGEGTRDSPMAVQSGSSSDVEEAKKKARSATGLGTVVEGEEGGEPGDGHHDRDCDGEGGEEERAGQKRKRYFTVVEGGKKRKVIDIVGVPFLVSLGCSLLIFSSNSVRSTQSSKLLLSRSSAILPRVRLGFPSHFLE